MTSRILIMLAMLAAIGAPAQAAPPNRVPPTMEIEVLDPNVDPEGNPAVVLGRGEDGQMTVEIPPTVLVHRYYYTGDRSFQAQLLPGGPSILVVNHPKTGKRTYIEAQLPPGAPRVTYRGDGIIYDYDQTAVRLHFGLLGKPTIKYRNGRTLPQTAARVVHLPHLKSGAGKLAGGAKSALKRCTTTAHGLVVVAGDTVKGVADPVLGLASGLPLAKTLFSGGLHEKMAQRLAEHKQQHQVKKLERQKKLDEVDIPTNR